LAPISGLLRVIKIFSFVPFSCLLLVIFVFSLFMYSPEPVSRSYKDIVGDCSWLEEIATHLNSTVIGEVLYPKCVPLPS